MRAFLRLRCAVRLPLECVCRPHYRSRRKTLMVCTVHSMEAPALLFPNCIEKRKDIASFLFLCVLSAAA